MINIWFWLLLYKSSTLYIIQNFQIYNMPQKEIFNNQWYLFILNNFIN